jgi:general stress protein YciG
MSLKRSEPTPVQCKATTSSGERCKAKPHKDNLCFFHSDPKKAAEVGRKGGKANRHTFETPLQEVVAPESVGDVKRMLAQTMANVIAGKTDPKLGTTVAYMAVALLRAYEAEPPASPARPSIYTALQYRTPRNAEVNETGGQMEVRGLGCVSTDSLVQDGGAEVARRKENLDYEILDYNSI